MNKNIADFHTMDVCNTPSPVRYIFIYSVPMCGTHVLQNFVYLFDKISLFLTSWRFLMDLDRHLQTSGDVCKGKACDVGDTLI